MQTNTNNTCDCHTKCLCSDGHCSCNQSCGCEKCMQIRNKLKNSLKKTAEGLAETLKASAQGLKEGSAKIINSITK